MFNKITYVSKEIIRTGSISEQSFPQQLASAKHKNRRIE